MSKYTIMRFYQQDGKWRRIMKKNLTLEEARAHCRDQETNSRTCKSEENVKHTQEHGPWFDGYEEE